MGNKTPSQMLESLGQPFPREAIKSRAGGGGKALAYVETHTVIHRLNSATDGVWDFHVRDTQWRDDLVIVLGELTIPSLGTRSGFGVQKVVERAGEDLVKGAVSDALKKCATLFGVALDLYGPDYEAGETQQMNRVTAMPQRVPDRVDDRQYDGPPGGPSGGEAATDRQRGLIQALAREQKITGAALDGRCMERFGVPFAEITRQQASTIIEKMKEAMPARPEAMA